MAGARFRMAGVVSDSEIPTPAAGKATIFYNDTDQVFKAKYSDGSVVIFSASPEAIQDIVASFLVDSATINFTYNDVGDTLTATVIQSALDISQIPNIPTGNLTAPNVQAALNELQSDIDTRATHIVTNNVIHVDKSGNDGTGNGTLEKPFLTINAALASITTNSSTNLFLIRVSPGIYIENTIVGKSYVAIIGDSLNSTIIEANNPNQHIIEGANAFYVSQFTLRGATGTNKYAIYFEPTSVQENFMVENIAFGNNFGLGYLKFDTGLFPTLSIRNVSILNGVTVSVGFIGESVSGNTGYLFIENFAAGFNSGAITNFHAIGIGSTLLIDNINVQSLGGGTFLKMTNGSTVNAKQISQSGFDIGVDCENVGSAPELQITGAIFSSITSDLSISHPGTTGAFQGLADSSKITVNSSSPIRLNYTDYVDPTTGSVVLGEMRQGDRHDRLLSISKLARQTSPTGAFTGGVVTAVSGLDINITSGSGFLVDSVGLFMEEISWSTVNITLPADTVNYIYVDSSGTVSISSSEPSILNNIVLGRVATYTSAIHFIDKSSIRNNQLPTRIEQYQREAIGPIYANGSIVIEVGVRGLEVSSGVYYFGNTRFAPSGATAFTWGYHYRDGVGGYNHGTQSVVDNAQYDNNSGTLVPLTPGYYSKHSLYLLGDGAEEKYHLVYSQVEYSVLVLAQQGNIPTPPPYFVDGVTLIATIIVQEGNTNIVEIRDERPIIGFKASGVSASTFHGNLLGLLADDHTQYLLVNGTRAMTGSLDMGSQSITNVNLVDGVDVSTHASRHLPTGTDPLTTAAPLLAIGGNTANQVGTANSLARSDHQHDVATGVPSTQAPDQSNSEGSSDNLARADHNHNIPTAAPSTALGGNSTNQQGISASFSRADHNHDIATGVPSTQTPDQTNSEGSSNNLARADHIHNIPADTAVGLDANSTSTEGAGTSFARNNHTHAISTGTPVAIGTSNAAGTSGNFIRADHVHDHGNQSVQTHHAAVTTSANGFMSASDKTKLDGIEPGATADQNATEVPFTPSGNILSTNVGGALNELDSEKADKTTTISVGAGLTGGGDLSANRTISMPAVGTPSAYGSASQVPVITTDAQGRVSSIIPTAISIVSSAVTDFATATRSTVLTGLSLATSSAIVAADTILIAFGKLQAQITTLFNRTISAGYGLTGGGDLSANRTLAVSLSFSNTNATNTVTTTSGADVLMTGMTLTPVAGTYLVLFSACLSGGDNDSAITTSIYAGGSLQAGSESQVIANVSGGVADPNTTVIPTNSFNIVTVNGSQAIEGRWRRASGTATATYRSLRIVRIA